MSENTYTVKQEESNSAVSNGLEVGQANQPQGRAIDRLFAKLQQATEKSEPVGAGDQCEQPSQSGGGDPSVINRLFNTYTRIEALPKPEEKIAVARITQTQIKAMKSVTVTAQSKPEVVIRKQCTNTVSKFWSNLLHFVCGFPAPKSK